MRRRYIISSIAALCLFLAIAWALAYFAAWYVGMGFLSFVLIATWADFMRRVIRQRFADG